MGGEKSRKAFVPFPFNGSDTVSGLSHLALGWKRKLQKLDPTFYVQRYLDLDLKGLSAVLIPDRFCHVCGFSVISLTAPNGWVLEACSAHDIEKGIKNGSLVNFLNEMGTQHSYNSSEERSRV